MQIWNPMLELFTTWESQEVHLSQVTKARELQAAVSAELSGEGSSGSFHCMLCRYDLS